MIQNPVINNSELVKSVNGINPDSSGNVTLPSFGSTDQWMLDWNYTAITQDIYDHCNITIPQHSGYTPVVAFAIATNGWVGNPYIITDARQMASQGFVASYFIAPTSYNDQLTVSCNFLYFKNS